VPKRSQVPTIKDVARVAGVSFQTVSRVINHKAETAEETRRRVEAAIEVLGYRPYSVARSLRTRRTGTLALVVSDIANPSFAAIASAAEDYAHAYDYNLVLYNTHEDPEREQQYIRRATERWVDGVLFVSVQAHTCNLEVLRAAGIPVVAIDRISEAYEGAAVTLDNLAAGCLAAEHLLGLGHVRLAHIAGPGELRLVRERREGFEGAIRARGLRPGPCVASGEGWGCAAGYRAMQTLLAGYPRPTAVFAANDRLAIGAMMAAAEASLVVPQDLSIMGLDDIELGAFHLPPLTTVRQDFGRLATLGVSVLLDMVAGNEVAQRQVLIEPVLVVRRSTGPCAGA
jgi:DNA-binding LacI/PurR family transcriptional regulator